jgi:hypothetical protein
LILLIMKLRNTKGIIGLEGGCADNTVRQHLLLDDWQKFPFLALGMMVVEI